MQKNSIIYCFVSHGEKILEDAERIPNMMSSLNYNDYIIVYGGDKKNIEHHNNIIHLNCDDSYCGLPEKINMMFKYVDNLKYNYSVKTDRTTVIRKLLPNHMPKKYMGHIYKYRLNRPITGFAHMSRCDDNHPWKNKKFNGDGILYCSGTAYVLDKECVSIVANDNTEYKLNVYEDYYVGNLLNKKEIYPFPLKVKDFFYDADHPAIFGD